MAVPFNSRAVWDRKSEFPKAHWRLVERHVQIIGREVLDIAQGLIRSAARRHDLGKLKSVHVRLLVIVGRTEFQLVFRHIV